MVSKEQPLILAINNILLSNPVYTGNLVHHRSECTKHLGNSEDYKIRNEIAPDEQIIVKNTHPAIIPQEGFNAVQYLMKKLSTTQKVYLNWQLPLVLHISFAQAVNSIYCCYLLNLLF
ncbi:recombinase family protein [Desulfoscipio gibsoniae]|uniref:recombinase family protein n=1 Tax=Desulfoscipio gibsoniae TaxID=102134 RepID=UPI0009FDDDC0|nr:recombinase family protein [Desulfoscipio gibsoniae]